MAEKDIALTPMMKQFAEFKAKHPDAILLFRCGDFYETYSTDAVIASEILGITLTKRSMARVPLLRSKWQDSRSMLLTPICLNLSVPAVVWRYATSLRILSWRRNL